ncbi:uncharacterized protein WM277_010927 [Molossus nigricans]
MFSCCVPTHRGFCFQRSRSESFSRRWFNPHLRRLYPFRRRSPESSAQEKGQELSDGVFNSTPPQEAQVSITPATLQDGHHRRSRSESFSRRWFNPHLRRLYPFRRRSPESSAQEKGQELSDGVFNSTPPQEAQVSITPATLQDGHHRRSRSESFSRRWFNPHLRRLYPFRRRSPESSAQEKGQELSDGVFNSTPPQEAQVSITPATLQDGHHRRSRSESFSRRWFNPHLRRLYPFRRRSPESSAQEKGQELSDGVFNSTPPQEAQVSITPATLQDGHHRRSRSESFSRRWFNPHLRRLYPFRRRSPESSAQEKGQELSDGVFNSTPPQEAQIVEPEEDYESIFSELEPSSDIMLNQDLNKEDINMGMLRRQGQGMHIHPQGDVGMAPGQPGGREFHQGCVY